MFLNAVTLQVAIGRSTGDTEVDIDLTKEGRASKISKRQVRIIEILFLPVKISNIRENILFIESVVS